MVCADLTTLRIAALMNLFINAQGKLLCNCGAEFLLGMIFAFRKDAHAHLAAVDCVPCADILHFLAARPLCLRDAALHHECINEHGVCAVATELGIAAITGIHSSFERIWSHIALAQNIDMEDVASLAWRIRKPEFALLECAFKVLLKMRRQLRSLAAVHID